MMMGLVSKSSMRWGLPGFRPFVSIHIALQGLPNRDR